MTNNDNKLDFLTSPRFWAMFLMFMCSVLADNGIITQDLLSSIQVFLGGFVVVGTTDKAFKKLGNPDPKKYDTEI